MFCRLCVVYLNLFSSSTLKYRSAVFCTHVFAAVIARRRARQVPCNGPVDPMFLLTYKQPGAAPALGAPESETRRRRKASLFPTPPLSLLSAYFLRP